MVELDDQQLTYLCFMAKGKTTNDVLKELHIGTGNLKKLRRSVFDALGATTWPNAIAIAFREGIFDVTTHEPLPTYIGEKHMTILRLVAEGVQPIKQVEILGVCKSVISNHLTQVYTALGVTCAEEAVYEACQTGLIEVKQ